MVARLERDARDRVQLLEDKLGRTGEVREELTGSLQQQRAEDRAVMEEAIAELETRLQTSMEDNKASELLVDALSDKNKELEASAANRSIGIGEVVQSRRRPILGPSPGQKQLLLLSHLRHYANQPAHPL